MLIIKNILKQAKIYFRSNSKKNYLIKKLFYYIFQNKILFKVKKGSSLV